MDTLTTPGGTEDLVPTEDGIAVTPNRAELAYRWAVAGMTGRSMDVLGVHAAARTTRRAPPRSTGRIVAVSKDRDGSVTNVVHQIKGD